MSRRTKLVNLIYSIATGSRKIRLILTPIVGLSYALFASLFVLVSFPIDNWLTFSKYPSFRVSIVLSIPLIIVGILIIIWTQLKFLISKGTPVPFNPPPKLVTNGPYTYIRNPMLSGIFILLFGLGFLFRSISLLIIFTPLFIIINFIELKLIEEPELELRFSKDYLEYKKNTLMFFPKIWQEAKKK